MLSGVIVAATLVSFAAGAAFMRAVDGGRGGGGLSRLAAIVAAGLSVTAILFQFTPIRWTSGGVRVVVLGCCAGLAWSYLRRQARSTSWKPFRYTSVLVLVVAIALAVRQDNAAPVPPGMDSPHHLMLTKMIARQGRVPETLAPVIPQGRLAYHWGAHANVAFAALFAGLTSPFEIGRALVAYSVFLRIVCCLAMYAAAGALFADRTAAILAGLITAGVSAVPAELLVQGRFTHLAGVAVLPALVASTVSGPRKTRVLLASVLLAGLFLIQVRLALFAAVWIGVVWLVALRRSRRASIHVLAVFLLAGALVAPWAIRLGTEPSARAMLRGTGYAQAKNRPVQRRIPPAMLWMPNSALLMSAATAGLSGIAGFGVSTVGRFLSFAWLILVLVASVTMMLRRRRRGHPFGLDKASDRLNAALLMLLLWVAGCAAILVARTPSIDATNIVPYSAGILTLFIPIVLAAAGVIAWTGRKLLRRKVWVATTAISCACVLMGWTQGPRFAIPSAVPEADLRGLRWISKKTPPDARFAVVAQPFNEVYIGYDAGYWLTGLTDRQSILPPLFYAWMAPAPVVSQINATLRTWTTKHPSGSVPQLKRAGITHAFFGSGSTEVARQMVRTSRLFEVVYDRDDVLIARLR